MRTLVPSSWPGNLPGSFAEGGPRRLISAKHFEAHLSLSNIGAKDSPTANVLKEEEAPTSAK